MGNRGEAWTLDRLEALLASVAAAETEPQLCQILLESVVAEASADAAALVRRGSVELALGCPGNSVERVLALVEPDEPAVVELDGMGRSYVHALMVGEESGLRLAVARRGSEPLPESDLSLLTSMCRVVSLGFRSLRLVRRERELRARSEIQADANARLLVALRERQQLLESLATAQRAIVARQPLHEVLQTLSDAAVDLLGVDVAVVLVTDSEDRDSVRIVASAGLDPDTLASHPGEPLDRETADLRNVVGERRGLGFAIGLEAAIRARGAAAGSLIVGSSDPERVFSAREKDTVLALAEHASLALNHEYAAREAAHESFHDALTGLPNRALLVDRIENALRRAQRSDENLAVLFCDLDGFKTVNDSLGHRAGDSLLALVGRRIAACVRPADTVARLGGDEFAVLVDEIREPSDAARAAGRILAAMEDPFDVGGREVYVGISIGIATGAGSVETLLRNADLAMYRAKSRGKGRYAVFETEMHTAIVERLDLETDLKRAIQNEELMLSYQPIYRLPSRKVAALEALVRWQHPKLGLVAPNRFVPLAEESGLVSQLGRWVMRTACHQAALWRTKYPAHTDLQMGVNISGVQLREPGLAADVADALAASGLDASALTLEITESALMEDSAAVVGRLEELKSLGVSLAVDDFGVGHSSLRYLKRFPLDTLKIDKVFVEGLGGPKDDPALVRAMIDLAGLFGLNVVGEGVEEEEQVGALVALGCDLGQGHHLSPPLKAEDADSLLLRSGLLSSDSGDEALETGSRPRSTESSH